MAEYMVKTMVKKYKFSFLLQKDEINVIFNTQNVTAPSTL